MKFWAFFFGLLLSLHSCTNTTNQAANSKLEDSSGFVMKNEDSSGFQKMNNLNNWIFGDFFGNGKVDTIRWLMRDSAGIEISNSSDSVQFDKLVELRGSQNPSCYLIGSMTPNNGIKIASNKQLNGLTFFKNEGDLNNDGIDEFSYVIEWLDQSNHNTFHVSQIKVSQIQELFAFPIWEWQLYDLQESESLVNKIESGKIEYYFRNDDFEVVTAQIKLPN